MEAGGINDHLRLRKARANAICGGPLVIGVLAGGEVNGITYPDLPVFEDVCP